ncbi:MAG: transposon-encoded TnpW family protein [Synergistaceae bacterium]|nr:transposon-encoded TnpW family protein [Synergistaceae bacterium]
MTEAKEMTEIIERVDTPEAPLRETAAIEADEGMGNNDAMTKPFKIRKRIGYTTYEVEARFNPASRETLDDKILRLVRGEAMKDSGGAP